MSTNPTTPITEDGELEKILREFGEYTAGCEKLLDDDEKKLLEAKAAIQALIERKVLAVWEYIAKTVVTSEEVIDLDTDPTGNTTYTDYHYSPPKKFVDEKIAELSKNQQ